MSYLHYLNAFGDANKLRRQVFCYTPTLEAGVQGPTIGVGCNANPTIYADAEALLVIDNTASRTDGDNVFVYPVQIEMWSTVRGTAGTFAAVRWVIDNATRWSSGGATLVAASTYYDTLTGYTNTTPKGQIHFGDVACITNSAQKIAYESLLQAGATVFAIGDTHVFTFGEVASVGSSRKGLSTEPAEPGVFMHSVPPISIGPGCSLLLQPLFTIMTAAASFGISVVTLELGHPRETA